LLADEDILNDADYQGLRDTRNMSGLSSQTKSLLISP
jgi:hypothetical protein